MDIGASAHRHDVPVEDMLHALRHQVGEVDDERKPYFVMLIGLSRAGEPLEIGVLDPDHEPVIIHAMNLRRNWRRYMGRE